MAHLQLEEVSQAEAARVMRDAGLRTAFGFHTAEQLAEGGECFRLTTADGSGVFVLSRAGDVLWIDGAGSCGGQGLTEAGLEVIERAARGQGCSAVGFQTMRRGLVRRAERAGFEVVGFLMKKAVPNGR